MGWFTIMDDLKIQVEKARIEMLKYRKVSDDAAKYYRAVVKSSVEVWRSEGLSYRKCADRINLSEGALKDLLRPDTQARRKKRRYVNQD